MSDLTLRKIRKIKNQKFSNLYEKLLVEKELSQKEKLKILEIALIFINSQDVLIKKFGYRIIVIYSNKYNDYVPLYEIAINQGLYPISHLIEKNIIEENRKNIFVDLNSAYTENFNFHGIYQSREQKEMYNFYAGNDKKSVVIVAPTSYGKSELIISSIKDNIEKKICIITPTKSLLRQTSRRIKTIKIPGISNIIVHSDMFNKNLESCVAVLTQERLLRILKDNPDYYFDYIIIDEAHNILIQDIRNEMLANSIMILNKRNPDAIFKFLTPFLIDVNNLKIRYTSYDLETFKINEYIKTEKFFLYDIRDSNGLNIYDQFLDKWFKIDSEPDDLDEISCILKYCGSKNIIYFNKPSDIEKFVKQLISQLPDIEINDDLQKVINNISSFIHPDYTLVKCLEKGIIYHHGSIPDVIRSYIENAYCTINEIKYVVTSSTLLEGVNLPAENIFLLDNKKGAGNLTPSAFKNLIGRVCRFSEIFNEKNKTLIGLEPKIYIIAGKYFSSRANYKKFVKESMKIDKTVNDKIDNVLLQKTRITLDNSANLKSAKEFIANFENGIIEDKKIKLVKTKAGLCCIKNRITELNIFEFEEMFNSRVEDMIEQKIIIKNPSEFMYYFDYVFLSDIDDEKINNENLKRFKNEPAKKFYILFLTYLINNESYSSMIAKMLSYWNHLINDGLETVVFVGKWGDVLRGGFRELWTDVSNKRTNELINLAIVRIKEEIDFVENFLIKFIEFFHDFNLIDESFYLFIKYGTDNKILIKLIQNGFSLSLSKLIIDKYSSFVNIMEETSEIVINEGITNQMVLNHENDIHIFEINENLI